MRIVIQTRTRFVGCDESYYESCCIEIESYRWLPGHIFEYCPVKEAR